MKVPEIPRPSPDHWRQVRVRVHRGLPAAVELDGEHFRIDRIAGAWVAQEKGFCGGAGTYVCGLYPTGFVTLYHDSLHGEWYVRQQRDPAC